MKTISTHSKKSSLSFTSMEDNNYSAFLIKEKNEPMATVMNKEKLTERESLIRMFVHEIRNPVTAINTANSLLENAIDEDKKDKVALKTFTDLISRNVVKVNQILKKLLDLNPEELEEFAPVEICQLIDNTLSNAEDRFFLRGVQVNRSYSTGHIVLGNAEKLSLAFLNIITNAVEAMNAGERKIWITVYRVNGHIRVIFKDNGKGMAPETVKHLFNSSFSDKPDGLGIGLTQVKEIFDGHQAFVSVNSVPEIGTSFIIEFKSM